MSPPLTAIAHHPSLRVGAGLALSAACLWLAFVSVPLDDLVLALGQAQYAWLIPAVAAQAAALVLRSIRWRILLQGRVGLRDLFWAQGIGFLATNVLPLRAGEAARVLVVNRQSKLPLVQVATSVVVERALDVATILGLLVVLLLFMPVPTAVLAAGSALGLALLVGAALVGTLVALGERGERIVSVLAGRLPGALGPPLVGRWRELATGLAPVRSGAAAVQLVGWSAAVWGLSVACTWAVIEAVSPGARWIEPAFCLAALAIGVSVPSSPGFVGVFQLVGQQALVVPFPDRYSPSEALTVALLSHLVYYVVTSGLGAVGLARLGLSLSGVRQAVAQSAAPRHA